MALSAPRTYHANVPQALLQTGFSFTDSRVALGRDIMCLFKIYIYIFLFLMIVRGCSKKRKHSLAMFVLAAIDNLCTASMNTSESIVNEA